MYRSEAPPWAQTQTLGLEVQASPRTDNSTGGSRAMVEYCTFTYLQQIFYVSFTFILHFLMSQIIFYILYMLYLKIYATNSGGGAP